MFSVDTSISLALRGGSSFFLFELGPTRVKLVCHLLGVVHLSVRTHKPRTIACDRRILQLSTLLLQRLLGLSDALLDGCILACFQVRELLFRCRRSSRKTPTSRLVAA